MEKQTASSKEEKKKAPRFNLQGQLKQLDEKIWHIPTPKEPRGPIARLYSLLRVILLTIQGVGKNKIPSQAAALAYASLIALGPMIALAIMISGFVLKDNAESFAVTTLHNTINFIAPSTMEYTQVETKNGQTKPEEKVNPQIVQLIENLVQKAGTGTGGAIGSLLLAVICIRLIISIENTFNLIWGVRRGRSLFQRILGYWAVLTLGAVLGFTVAGLLTTSALVGQVEGFAKDLPLGLSVLAKYGAPMISFCTLISLLTLFYRYIPNTNVRWMPAFVGGFVVTLLILLNYFLSFFYVSYVVRQQSLYGSIGIVFVLMFGLYIFWLFMLLGGQITYAVQNMEHVAHERAWKDASAHVRQLLALAVFLECGRRFEACEPPPDASALSEKLAAPLHLVNEALSSMCERGLLSAVETPTDKGDIVLHYQPSRPLDKIRVIDLRFELDNEGNSEGLEVLAERDSAIARYIAAMRALRESPELGASMHDLIRRSQAV